MTVSTVEPLTPPSVALIVEVPVARPVASPAAVMVATAWRGRGPGHLAGQVLRRAVGEGAGGGERLGRHPWRCWGWPASRRSTCRAAGVTVSDRRAGDAARAWRRSWRCPSPGRWPRPAAVMVATRGGRGGPGHLAGQVLRRAVGVGAGGGELLGLALGAGSGWPASPRSTPVTPAFTVSTVEPVTPSSVALIVDVPGANPAARPAAEIVATEGSPRPRSPDWSGPAWCRRSTCRWR